VAAVAGPEVRPNDADLRRPFLDVVIPTIGRPELADAVRSAASHVEVARVIVVLDRPAALVAVQDALAGLPKVELVATSGAQGGGAARQQGLLLCDAPFVAFLDDDDVWLPNRGGLLREALLRVPAERRQWTFVLSRFVFERKDGTSDVVPRELPEHGTQQGFADYILPRRDLRFGRNAVQTSACAVSLPLALAVGWDIQLPKHQDWDFAIRCLSTRSAELATIAEPSVSVRQASTESVSRTHNWAASSRWLEDRRSGMSARAASDFAWSHVLRAALAQRSLGGLARFVRLRPFRPHLAACVIGLSGAAEGIRRRPGAPA
jgi:hypothetical protein